MKHFAIFFITSFCLLIAGCAEHSAPKPPPAAAEPASTSSVADACAARMHDINGAMLLYFTQNHHLPDRLEELRPLAVDIGTTLQFTCPVSGEQYVYVPAGIAASNIEPLLVMYDASPVHNGKRWGIVMKPVKDNQPIIMWVIPIDDRLFAAYVPSSLKPAR